MTLRPVLAVSAAALCLAPLGAEADPAVTGQWSPRQTWAISTTHNILLPTGKLLIFGEFDQGEDPPLIWDPATGTSTHLSTTPDYNIFCSGHAYLGDGRVLITGGHRESHVGFEHGYVFDPSNNTMTRTPDMNDNRWYPTNTTLPNGDALTIAGETEDSGENNLLPQVFQARTNTWRDLTNAKFDMPYYPREFVTPQGRVLVVMPKRATRYLDTAGKGAWITGPTSQCCARTYGPAVVRDGKIYMFGGGDPPTETVEMLDMNAEGANWTYMAPMSVPRRQHNAVFLPDGKVLIVGGSQDEGFSEESGAVYKAELFDPDANTWTTLASMSDFHGYHSTSLLLPDGRVFMGGGRGKLTVEIFSPPYLFKGAKPTVTAIPTRVNPGDVFPVNTPDAARIRKVSLINLGAVTHAFDEGSRFITLPFTRVENRLDVRMPDNNNLVPPGPYQVFIVNDVGVPSTGRIVMVGVKPGAKTNVVSLGDDWKYNDLGVDPGPNWMNPGYDDSSWPAGPGQLGYGDLDQATTLTKRNPVQPSYYFRKKFQLTSPVTAAEIELIHDDGVAVWVNGVQVFSYGLGNGTSYGAWATVSVDNKVSRFTLNLTQAPLRVGDNTIAVLVKQVSATSNDLSFALQLSTGTASVSDSVVLNAPNGGERLAVGGTTNILWETAGQVRSTVDLKLSLDNGATWSPIALAAPNTGRYTWTVPNWPSTQALVKVSSSLPPEISDTSNAVFTIGQTVSSTPIPFHSVWKYRADGLDPGTTWNATGFDDSTWASGAAELGYGDGDEATVLQRTTPSQTSVYFRKTIQVSGPVTAADVAVKFDDGMAIYVNGTLATSWNMDSGLLHTKYASASEENRLATATLSPTLFTTGTNVVAVMVKQVGATSPDLSFDLELHLQSAQTSPGKTSSKASPWKK